MDIRVNYRKCHSRRRRHLLTGLARRQYGPDAPYDEREMEVGGMSDRKRWSPMHVDRVGTVADVLRMPGGGKLSAVGGDPGDPRKPKGQG